MNQSQLRQKIETQLDQLSLERLTLVSQFLDAIQAEKSLDSPKLRKIQPIRRGKKARDLVRHIGTWQGDDLEDCLEFVRATRSKTKF